MLQKLLPFNRSRSPCQSKGEKVIGTPAVRSSAAAGHAWQSDTLPAALVLSAVRAGSQITDGAPAGSRSGSRHSSGSGSTTHGHHPCVLAEPDALLLRITHLCLGPRQGSVLSMRPCASPPLARFQRSSPFPAAAGDIGAIGGVQ